MNSANVLKLESVVTCVSGAVWAASVLAGDAPAAGSILLQDDFEAGFSPGWAQCSAVEVVAEDPDNPAGNHVARFTKARGWLATPFKDLKDAEAREDMMAQSWRDYEFSFRWRVGTWDQDKVEQAKGNAFGLFAAGYRACPSPDYPSLRYMSWFGVWRRGLTWRLQTPFVVWDSNVHFDQKNIEKVSIPEYPTDKSRVLDTAWHTFKVTVVGERVTVYWDGELYFVGTDDRAPYGGVSIESWCDMPIEHLDVDDVLVKRIGGNEDENQTGHSQ